MQYLLHNLYISMYKHYKAYKIKLFNKNAGKLHFTNNLKLLMSTNRFIEKSY